MSIEKSKSDLQRALLFDARATKNVYFFYHFNFLGELFFGTDVQNSERFVVTDEEGATCNGTLEHMVVWAVNSLMDSIARK